MYDSFYFFYTKEGERRRTMSKLNHEAAPNNNLPPETIRASKMIKPTNHSSHEFSEEISDGAERNQIIKQQQKNQSKGKA